IPRAINHEDIIRSTKEDPALQEVISRLRGSKLNFKNRSYRATLNCSTVVPPAELIFKYSSTTRLVSVMDKRIFLENDQDKLARERDLKAKQVIKCNGDRKLRAKKSQLNIDELVLYQKPRGKVFDKKEPVRDPNPWRVEEANGSMVTARSSDGKTTHVYEITNNKIIKQIHFEQNFCVEIYEQFTSKIHLRVGYIIVLYTVQTP
ncbi:hypothetical protein BpHYR1_035853, partial [Brachionus plicatilis]